MSNRSRQKKHGGGKFKSERLANANGCGRLVQRLQRGGLIIVEREGQIG